MYSPQLLGEMVNYANLHRQVGLANGTFQLYVMGGTKWRKYMKTGMLSCINLPVSMYFLHLVPAFDIIVEKGLLSGSCSNHYDIHFC